MQLDKEDREAAELNEVGWWSGWGNVRWLDARCYVLESRDFNEPFFNRAGFLSCNASAMLLGQVEAAFNSTGQAPHVTLFESCRKAGLLLKKRGYEAVDMMTVMQMRTPSMSVNEAVHIREGGAGEIGRWCDVYLLSFYGDLALRPRVVRVVERISRLDSVTLLLAELNGKIAGVAALYRTPSLLGLYCLGTLLEFRGKRVAHSLLGRAQALAESEGRKFILQSLRSEGAESFYYEAGFQQLYTKGFRQKMADGISQEAKGRGVTYGASVRRDAGVGLHPFKDVFVGFEEVPAVRSIFGETTRDLLSKLQVEVVDEKGYMHIDTVNGSVIVGASYLKGGDRNHLYLDIIHELVHVRQHMEGKELWDRRYKYVDRPTELEAYGLAVAEARRIGLTDEQLVDYLKVEWVSKEDFARFLATLGVKGG